jgi:hypothetical protein
MRPKQVAPVDVAEDAVLVGVVASRGYRAASGIENAFVARQM